MYTIQVSNLPKDVTEQEISKHFSSLCISGDPQPVVAVHLVVDNSDEIDLYTQRGQIIRDRIHLVHVSNIEILSDSCFIYANISILRLL